MSVGLSRLVLWGFLWVLLPLPVFGGHTAFAPLLYLVKEWPQAAGYQTLGVVLVLAVIGLTLICYVYGRWSANWPYKIRGSVVGLIGLVSLIMLSSVPIYEPFGEHQSRLEFRQLYSPNLEIAQ
ncbi:MAG: hypothetical protein V7711_09700 [Pseudomonadales bacterium]